MLNSEKHMLNSEKPVVIPYIIVLVITLVQYKNGYFIAEDMLKCEF